MARPKRLTPESRELMLNLYAHGTSTKNVSIAMGYGLSTVTLVLREARAECDPRAIIDPGERALAMDDTNRAPLEAARSDAGDINPRPTVLGVAPNSPVVSLMARGVGREKAVEQIAADLKAKERREAGAPTPTPVIRFNSKPFKIGAVSHAAQHEGSSIQCIGSKPTKSFGGMQ